MLRQLAVLFVLLLQVLDARAEQQEFEDRLADAHEIRMESVSETSSDGSSGSTHDVWTIMERVVALHDNGVELEFDLPEGTSREGRARNWQFPVRVLSSPGQSLQLLNRSELEARVRAWLERGGFTEAACGRWIFTWTAIKIECEPHSVLETLEPFDLRWDDLREGAAYGVQGARGPVPLKLEARSSDGQILVADMEIDPEVERHARAETDMVVAEIMREPVTLETALASWARRQISGTIRATLSLDATGRVTRRIQVTNIVVIDEAGSQERETTTVTTEWRRVSP